MSSRTQTAQKSAAVLERTLGRFRGELTIADAATRGGLALRDAEAALLHLSSEYHGHVAATDKGDLVFSFPRGLSMPLSQGRLAKAARTVGRALLGVGRFVVRAWVSVVVVAYAIVLGVVLIALAAKSEDGVGDAVWLVLRIILEALFWTFHPLSPVVWDREPAWLRRQGRRHRKKELPFYEKVNQFVFGPPKVKPDPRQRERHVLAEIRRLEGRVAPGDIMRVTGLSRQEAEGLLCRMVVDYDGELHVTEEGAVVYRFPAVRRTAALPAESSNVPAPRPIWQQMVKAPPITGNSKTMNVLFGALNGFNLAASGYIWANGLTFERIAQLLEQTYTEDPGAPIHFAEAVTGTPVVLGVVPFIFSAALFALPAARLAYRRVRERRAAHENARRAILKLALDRLPTDATLGSAELERLWKDTTGHFPRERELTDVVRTLGGEPDVNDTGQVIYRFPELTRESKALRAERQLAPQDERSAGQTIFSSTD